MTDVRLLTSPDDDDRRGARGSSDPRTAAPAPGPRPGPGPGTADGPRRDGGRPALRVPWAEATGYDARRPVTGERWAAAGALESGWTGDWTPDGGWDDDAGGRHTRRDGPEARDTPAGRRAPGRGAASGAFDAGTGGGPRPGAGGTVARWDGDRLVPARRGGDTGRHGVAGADALRGGDGRTAGGGTAGGGTAGAGGAAGRRRREGDGTPALWSRPASGRRRGRNPLVGSLATGGVVAAGLVVGWVVLVLLRSPSAEASDALASRIDAAIAETMLAERVLSFATWITSVATLLTIGGTLFRLFIVPPHHPVVDGDGIVRARSRRPGSAEVSDAILRGAATLGIVATLSMVPLRAMSLEGGRTAAALDPDDLWFVLSGRFGGSILLRVAGLSVLLVALADRPRSWGHPPRPTRRSGPDGSRPAVVNRPEPLLGRARRRQVVFVIGTVIVLAAYSLVGHPQATAPQVVNVPAQWAHVTVAAAWFGGVTFLGVELRHQWRTGSARYTAEVVARFSAMAEVSIVVAAVTGVVLANSQIHAPTAVLESGYGRAFVGKMIALGIVLAIGGYNQQRLVPAIVERDEPAAWDHLRRAIFLEVALIALGVLLMTAAMTSGGF